MDCRSEFNDSRVRIVPECEPISEDGAGTRSRRRSSGSVTIVIGLGTRNRLRSRRDSPDGNAPMESSTARSLNGPVEQARQRTQSTLNRWMAACRPGLRRRAGKQLSRELDRKEDASDLVQKVLLRATIQFDGFKGQSIGEFYTWLSRIQDKLVLKLLRHWHNQRRNVGQEKPVSPAWNDQREFAASSTWVPDRLARKEECDRLILAASWCREEDRAVIFLHLFEGQSHEEIAADLGIAPAAVRQRYCRAVRRVRAAMQLLDLMTRRGFRIDQQDAIGVHRFQGADPGQIAQRLEVPEGLVARWIAEAQPLFRAIAKDGS
jgi:RNA polymerase sigma-70 factor, ECF subfamily